MASSSLSIQCQSSKITRNDLNIPKIFHKTIQNKIPLKYKNHSNAFHSKIYPKPYLTTIDKSTLFKVIIFTFYNKRNMVDRHLQRVKKMKQKVENFN